jgi:hypothetical protein
LSLGGEKSHRVFPEPKERTILSTVFLSGPKDNGSVKTSFGDLGTGSGPSSKGLDGDHHPIAGPGHLSTGSSQDLQALSHLGAGVVGHFDLSTENEHGLSFSLMEKDPLP